MEPETGETGTLEYIKSHSDVVMEHVSEFCVPAQCPWRADDDLLLGQERGLSGRAQ